jgi:hypothetical protein
MVSLALVPSVEQLEAASEEELCAFLGTLPHFPGVGAKARPIVVSVHKAHLRADLVTSRAKSRLMLALVAQLSVLLDQIAAYDAEIERRFRAHPAPIPRPSRCASVHESAGSGQTLGATLAGWRDDRSRYASAQSVQGRTRACKGVPGPRPWRSKAAGMSRRASDGQVSSRYGPRSPSLPLSQFAWESTKEAWALADYQRKRPQGKSHSVAVRALANHWVRRIHAIWRSRQPYDPRIFLAAQQAQGRARGESQRRHSGRSLSHRLLGRQRRAASTPALARVRGKGPGRGETELHCETRSPLPGRRRQRYSGSFLCQACFLFVPPEEKKESALPSAHRVDVREHIEGKP